MMAIEAFKQYHPLFVEGPGEYDTRDPALVADAVAASVRTHWERYPPSKPPLLIIQGDPLESKGHFRHYATGCQNPPIGEGTNRA